MKKLIFSLVFFVITFVGFLFLTPHNNTAQAVLTCTSVYGGTCYPPGGQYPGVSFSCPYGTTEISGSRGSCSDLGDFWACCRPTSCVNTGYICAGLGWSVNCCEGAPVSCQYDSATGNQRCLGPSPTPTTAPGTQCAKDFTGGTCKPSTICNSYNGLTSKGTSDCTSGYVCCVAAPTSTPTPTPHYTCGDLSGQYCSPETCTNPGEANGSGTCQPSYNCCKTAPTCSNTYGVLCGNSSSPTGLTCCSSANLTCGIAASNVNATTCKCTQGYNYDASTDRCIASAPVPSCATYNNACSTTSCCSNQNTVCGNTGYCNCPPNTTFNGTACVATTSQTIETSGPFGGKTSGDVVRCVDGTSGFLGLCNIDLKGKWISGIITFLLIAAIVVALIYLIWGGIRWIMSHGDKANLESAREHVIGAVVGLVIILLVYFVLSVVMTFFGIGGFNLKLPNIIG